jgi:uncharacterized protein YqgC (DUF456 family)
MDYVLLILAIIVSLLGIIGCVLPVLPGPILNYAGLLMLHFTRFGDVSSGNLLFLALLTVIVQMLDYVVPVWGTKKFGGSRYGTWGSIIGLIAGLFFLPAIGPFGIVTILGGPFVGAYLGEKLAGNDSSTALRAAFGSFIGFLAGTVMKLANSLIILWFFIRELIQYF